ncbi:MAG TPA: hypothetical protein VHQ20_00190 [Patescibacteria group bacterium]|jgi:hypothetical protein|nr:hypothetical protein [Patescibacteria group bacterium]
MTSEKFEHEDILIRTVLEPEEIVEIELINETENFLEITVLVTPDEYIQSYVRPLRKIGYEFSPEASSIIKLSFQKGDTFKYQLNLSQAN